MGPGEKRPAASTSMVIDLFTEIKYDYWDEKGGSSSQCVTLVLVQVYQADWCVAEGELFLFTPRR